MAESGVCIVAPPVQGPAGVVCTTAQTAWIEKVRALAKSYGHSVTIFRTVARLSERKDESGRRLFLLDPWEADRLYKLIHRGCYAVFQAGQARVLPDPLSDISSATSISLERLIRYKSCFAQFDGATEPSELFVRFDAWAAAMPVSTHRDCRVLPLHMFSPSHDWLDLMQANGQHDFERMHGKPTQLADECARHWKQPSAVHGNDSLFVANHPLPTGFHWDVTAARTVSRLTSLIERWKFPPSAYANVSPDGHVRGGQSSAISARREGSAPRPPDPESARGGRKTSGRHQRSDGTRH
jgi:hypothetical protein